jgi:hypothetical protein
VGNSEPQPVIFKLVLSRYASRTLGLCGSKLPVTDPDITANGIGELSGYFQNRHDSTNLRVNQDQLCLQLDKFLIATEGLKLQPPIIL